MTFYLEYRPQKISDLGLKEVKENLIKMVDSQKIPHAMLLSGPKGTGKTSAARIIAKVLNCERNDKKFKEPCNKCSQCLSIKEGSNIDVIELDAASHRGIDDMRAIRDAVKLSPAYARKKIYIIDESHMLTTEASNALLKTLEEPPEHVAIIMATTNPEKLIDTIRSRTVEIKFRKAKQQELIKSLESISRREKKKFNKKILELIAKTSDGSFRDAHKLLEQIINEKLRSLKNVKAFLKSNVSINIKELYQLVVDRKVRQAVIEIENLIKQGFASQNILDKLQENVRENLNTLIGVINAGPVELTKDELINLSDYLFEAQKNIPNSYIEHMPLEIAIIKWCEENAILEIDDEDEEIKRKKKINIKKEIKRVKKEDIDKKNIDTYPDSQLKAELDSISDEMWTKILSEMRTINTSIEALLRATKPVQFDGKTLTLGVFYRFHKERLEEQRNLRVLESVLGKMLSSETRVNCILTQPPVKVIEEKKKEVILEESDDQGIMKVAKDIFGS